VVLGLGLALLRQVLVEEVDGDRRHAVLARGAVDDGTVLRRSATPGHGSAVSPMLKQELPLVAVGVARSHGYGWGGPELRAPEYPID